MVSVIALRNYKRCSLSRWLFAISRPIVVIVRMDSSSESWSSNSTHIHGTHVPVEEPSTASEADMAGRICNVRFTPKSGHRETLLGCPLCANKQRSRIGRAHWAAISSTGRLANCLRLLLSLRCGSPTMSMRPTLGELQRATPWVWLWCERCHHHAPLACAVAVIRWGPDAPSDKLRTYKFP